jgi:hypothetical protein
VSLVLVYATLGVFLLIATGARRRTSLIWFTVWSSVVHPASWASVMTDAKSEGTLAHSAVG